MWVLALFLVGGAPLSAAPDSSAGKIDPRLRDLPGQEAAVLQVALFCSQAQRTLAELFQLSKHFDENHADCSWEAEGTLFRGGRGGVCQAFKPLL